MPDSALSVLFQIDADPSSAQAKLKEFEAQVGNSGAAASKAFTGATDSAAKLGPAVAGAGKAAEEGLLGSRESARLLSEEFGLHLPRGITTAISNIEGLGGVLEAVAPAAIGLFAAMEAPKAILAIGKMIQGTEQIAAAWKDAAAAIQQADVELNRLDIEHRNVQRELAEMGLSEAAVNKLKVDFAQTDVKLAGQEAEDAQAVLDRARQHLEVPKQQHAQIEAMGAPGSQTATEKLLGVAGADISAQEAAIAKLSSAWEVAQGKAQKAKDDLDLLNRSIQTSGEAAAGAAPKFDRWLNSFEGDRHYTLPKYQSDMERLTQILDDAAKLSGTEDWRRLAAFLSGDFKAAGLTPAGGPAIADPFGALGGSAAKAIAPLHELDMSTASYLHTILKIPPAQKVFDESQERFKTQSTVIIAQYGLMKDAEENYFEAGKRGFMDLTEAMGQSAVNALLYRKSFTEAMESAAKDELASLAKTAIVEALRSGALGFYDLAIGDFTGAGFAFESAAMFGSIAGVAGGLGAAIPGGGARTAASASPSRGFAGPGGAGSSGGYAPRSTLAPGAAAPPGGQLNVILLGEQTQQQWFAENIVNPYVNSGGTLLASRALNPTPAAG